MKRLLSVLVALVMVIGLMGGCGSNGAGTSGESTNDQNEVSSTGGKSFKVGYATKNQDNPFQQAFVKAIQEEGKKRGWKVTVLDAQNKVETEQANMETFISQSYDLIFINVVDTLASAQMCRQAKEAGIPVIAVDSNVDPVAEVVSLVACNNLGGGAEVGHYLVTQYDANTEIKAALLSGNKGNTGGQERRVGLFAGIIASRTQMSDEDALKAAWEFDKELTQNGKASYEAAKFEIVGQGWGGWTTDQGLVAAEDLITANPDMNAMLAENDSMLLGGMKALENSGMLDKVQLFASHDGMKEALEHVKKGSQYKASGLNIPSYVVAKAYEIAQQILVDGVSVEKIEPKIMTPAMAITKENVDSYYDPDAIF